MKFVPLELKEAFVIEREPLSDERGFFARTFCKQEFTAHGLVFDYEQASVSFNIKLGTIRGLHLQTAPHEETKLVRCSRGSAWDVIVDLRKHSPTFKRWQAIEISAENGRTVYIPCGFGHGFQTLEDHTELLYQISTPHVPSAATGIRYNDPDLGIKWPLPVSIISNRDQALPLLYEFNKMCHGTTSTVGSA